jgi:class III poly(R)-hydroxyalkanoic acid synthase PhaE subunit
MDQNYWESNDFGWSQWIESVAGLWVSAAQGWQELSSSLAGGSAVERCVQASLSLWRSFEWPWPGLQDFGARESSQPSFDMIHAMMRVMDYQGLNKEISKWLWVGGAGADPSFEKIQHEALKVWTDFHEKAIRPLLKIPQVGLTRVFQEKIGRFTDRFNNYQAAVSEFQMLLSVPMEKSFITMREELDRLKEKGELSEDYKVYYAMWIKVLENHYMSLFKSDEYRQSLARFINETAALRLTGNEVLTEFLEFLPIPTNKDMDEVYKEVYMLKKQVRETAKRISTMESALAKENQ